MGSYLSNQAWQDFQNYLPLRNRLTEDIRCKEEYVFFNDIQIHCDVYQPPYFKGTLILLHGLCGNGRLMSFLSLRLSGDLSRYAFVGIYAVCQRDFLSRLGR